jgi:hypothetical protein
MFVLDTPHPIFLIQHIFMKFFNFISNTQHTQAEQAADKKFIWNALKT